MPTLMRLLRKHWILQRQRLEKRVLETRIWALQKDENQATTEPNTSKYMMEQNHSRKRAPINRISGATREDDEQNSKLDPSNT